MTKGSIQRYCSPAISSLTQRSQNLLPCVQSGSSRSIITVRVACRRKIWRKRKEKNSELRKQQISPSYQESPCTCTPASFASADGFGPFRAWESTKIYGSKVVVSMNGWCFLSLPSRLTTDTKWLATWPASCIEIESILPFYRRSSHRFKNSSIR